MQFTNYTNKALYLLLKQKSPSILHESSAESRKYILRLQIFLFEVLALMESNNEKPRQLY
jgi:hypothetical protein